MFIHTYEAKTYNQVWHKAAFNLPKEYQGIIEWCHETFGKPGYLHESPQTRWADDIFYGEVYFSQLKDLEWFVLRWS
jgi:hypothetical protein